MLEIKVCVMLTGATVGVATTDTFKLVADADLQPLLAITLIALVDTVL